LAGLLLDWRIVAERTHRGSKPIRTTMKVLAEVLDSMDVGTNSAWGKVAATQLLKHELT
jgi:hypothetical protein